MQDKLGIAAQSVNNPMKVAILTRCILNLVKLRVQAKIDERNAT